MRLLLTLTLLLFLHSSFELVQHSQQRYPVENSNIRIESNSGQEVTPVGRKDKKKKDKKKKARKKKKAANENPGLLVGGILVLLLGVILLLFAFIFVSAIASQSGSGCTSQLGSAILVAFGIISSVFALAALAGGIIMIIFSNKPKKTGLD